MAQLREGRGGFRGPVVEHIPQENLAKKCLEMFAEMANTVLDSETGEMLEYRQLIKKEKHREVEVLDAKKRAYRRNNH